jgi:2-methylcitrate dehydratase PrpD
MTSAGLDALIDFASGIDGDQIPNLIRGRAALILLDFLGVAALGARDPFLRRLRAALAGDSQGPATIIGTGYTAHPGLAAMFNAATCSVTQIDEGHRESQSHPGIHVLPAVMAVAEQERVSGYEMITALVVGYEFGARLSKALSPLKSQVHPHGNLATIGAAVGVAKLLGASRQQIKETVESAAAVLVHGPESSTRAGASSHHLFAGLGAQSAVIVGRGAIAGMTGTPGTVDKHLLSLDCLGSADAIVAGKGEWAIVDSYFKMIPACAHLATTVEALDSMLPGIDTAQVVGVSVETYAQAAALNNSAPASALAAKFSIPFAVAARLRSPNDSYLTLHFTDHRDGDLKKLMQRVSVREDPRLSPQYPACRPTRVTIALQDGRKLSATRDIPTGDARRPVTERDLIAKFLSIARHGFVSTTLETIAQRALDIDVESDVSEFFAMLRAAAIEESAAHD